MAEKNLDKLDELERASGALAFTSLSARLARRRNKIERTKLAELLMSSSLLYAIWDEKYVQEIKKVSEKYPDLIPLILECEMKVKNDKQNEYWLQYESDAYRDFIASLSKSEPR